MATQFERNRQMQELVDRANEILDRIRIYQAQNAFERHRIHQGGIMDFLVKGKEMLQQIFQQEVYDFDARMIHILKHVPDDPLVLEVENMEPVHDAFMCRITSLIIKDPVIVLGNPYERRIIQDWIESNQKRLNRPATDPVGSIDPASGKIITITFDDILEPPREYVSFLLKYIQLRLKN